MSLTEVLTLTR